jgi:hypothetical protein
MWLAAGALATLVVFEGIFTLLPVSGGLGPTEQFERWPLQGYQPRQSYTYSRGWQMILVNHGTTNNYGHVAPFDYREGSHPVIVAGDSYVESLMNAYGDTVQGQLGELLGSRESVYGLGYSGLSASDYFALSRLAKQEFAPTAAIFIIFNGDIAESLLARTGFYHFVPQGDSFRLAYLPLNTEKPMKALRRTITGLPLYRYIFGNLGFSSDAVFKFARGKPQPEADSIGADPELQRRVIDYFLAQLPGALGLPSQCIAFLVDSDRYAIYDPRLASAPKETPDVRRYFLDRAQALGFAVSDLDPVFRARYARDRTKFDYWPIDRHWNRTGHGVAADEAYRLLFGAGKRECLPGSH